MNKEYILKKNEEIEKVVKSGKKSVSNFFIIYNKENNSISNLYCVSVSKKIGKAHVRNKIKRRIKDILMNIKPENLVLDENGYMRVTDFGITKMYKNFLLTLLWKSML